MFYYKLSILHFLFFCSTCIGQNADTTINGKHFNYIEYYPSTMVRGPKTTNKKQLLCIGNYVDSTKNNYWVYFDLQGNIFAKGDYKNGRKIGNWYYHSKKHGYNFLKWEASEKISEQILFSDDETEMIDCVKNEAGETKYVNGYRPPWKPIHRM